MTTRQGMNDHYYRKKRDRLKRNAPPVCWICHELIDRDLDYRDPMSWTADHVVPLANGGAMLGELRPAHRGCNSRRGNREETNAASGFTSPDW